MRVEVDEIVSGVVKELKALHNVKTNKEIIEKCILFCYENKVQLDKENPKSINDLYVLMDKLNKEIGNLPLKIAMVLDLEDQN